MTAPTESELLQMADDLLEAFTTPWKDSEPSALHVNDLVDNVVYRPPPTPYIGNIKAATRSDGVPAWILKQFIGEFVQVSRNASTLHSSKLYKHALVSPVPNVKNPEDLRTTNDQHAFT